MNCSLVANHEMYQGPRYISVIYIDLCIWPPGGINMSKNWKKSKYHRFCSYFTCTMNCKLVANHEIYRVQHFSHIDFCIWPPGGSDMSKNWKKPYHCFC